MPVALEWGPVGARTLAERSDVVVVVDVLSFSTALTIAVERGALVWPHVGGESARQLARDIGAVLAGTRSSHEGLTLSPESSPTGVHCALPTKPNRSHIWVAVIDLPFPRSTSRRTISTASSTRSAGGSSTTSCERYAGRTVTPRTTLPAVGARSPMSSRINDVLPDPFTPAMPIRSPGPTSQVRWSSSTRPPTSSVASSTS